MDSYNSIENKNNSWHLTQVNEAIVLLAAIPAGIYWYVLLPFHYLIFRGLAQALVKADCCIDN